MEILDKKSNRMSQANAGVSECNEFPDLQRILDFLSLRNLLSNELFFNHYSIFIICSLIFSNSFLLSTTNLDISYIFDLTPIVLNSLNTS